MRKRAYKITFDLKEGYSPGGKVHSIEEVSRIISNWMTARLEASRPVLSGFLQVGQLIYPAKGKGKEAGPVTSNPSAVYMGELSTAEDSKRKNKEVKDTLEALAFTLKNKLKQEAVYIIYRQENWCI
jgi:hypothetical protein